MQTKTLVFMALFIAIIAVTGIIPAIPIPVIAVPITLQTLGIMLTGSLLGAKKGFVATLAFVLIVAAGAPFLAGGTGGLGVLLGPTGGYVMSWPIGALVIGLFTDRIRAGEKGYLKLIIGHILGGIVVIYAGGILFYSYVTHTPILADALGNIAFLPGDSIKIILSIVITLRLKDQVAAFSKSKQRAA